MAVEIAQLPGGGWRVTTLADTWAEASAKAKRIEEVCPEAFKPTPQPLTPAVETEVVSHGMAQARLRDLPPPEDDEGEPYPIPGCATGVCSGE